MTAMRMRKSLDEIEAAFTQEISLERDRRQSLIRSAEHRAVRREVARRHRSGSMRFVLLVLTAVIVTVVMFRVLYLLLA
jgi:hypothetical protein